MSNSTAAQFSLSPNILQLGFAYLATQSWIDRAVPLMKELSERVHEFVLGLDPAGDRDRICGARADQADHVGGGVGGEPPAGLPYRHGPFQLGFLDDAESGAGSNPSASSR